MPIDAKRIVEIKALVAELTKPGASGRPLAGEPDCCLFHQEKWIQMRSALVDLLGEREEVFDELEGWLVAQPHGRKLSSHDVLEQVRRLAALLGRK